MANVNGTVNNVTKFVSDNIVYLAIAGGAFILASKFLKGNIDKAKANVATRVYEATVATTDTTVEELKNNLLKMLYAGALNPTTVLTNLEAIKSEVDTYTAKLTTLAAEKAAGRIDSGIINYYLKTIAEEIAKELHIEFRPNSAYGGGYGGYPYGGGYGGFDPYGGGYGGYPYGGGGGYPGNYYPYGGNDDYQKYLDNYLKSYQQYQQQLSTQYGGAYGWPNYGYSYGYGYQQPNVLPQYPTQNYNYYPNQYPTQPYYSSAPNNYYQQSPAQYGGSGYIQSPYYSGAGYPSGGNYQF